MSSREPEKIPAPNGYQGFRIAECEGGLNPQSEIRNPRSVTTLVALATYNEIENLPSLVEAILSVLPYADVLVVDDNSPDGTGAWCDERGQSEPRLLCVHRPGKLGLGTALLQAARFAMERGYEILLTLDADWSHDPSEAPGLIATLGEADVAIGSRYCPGGEIEGWRMSRRLMSTCVNGLTRALLRLPIRDASGNFRAYRVAKLREVRLDDSRASGYSFLEELAWKLHRGGAVFAETPITFRDRRAGASKINLRESWGKLATILRLSLQR